ncbi:MmgE/PrpD family protein [Falsiroseomonas ponticola]|uniref:MmgE/PrpD family protein n=1 Tax=Falsiroseomonas ponticola TaxID=2786951 RepID=UPI0019348E7A|nr:MmgE/PrpD family protein [Roseomonas ponticola]
MEQPGTTQRIAAWIATVPRDRIARAAPLAIEGMRDAIGVILAGAAEPVPRKAFAAVSRWGAGPSRIIGRDGALAAPWAALVNGAAAHVLDYDDTFAPLSGHATAVLVPAILALGEERGASGPDLLDALVVGLEVMACVGRGVNPKHYALGWHATSTIGAIGAAAACARLMRLDTTQARDALSLGVSMAAGTRMQLGAEAKSMHAGFAAKDGILAATLAEAGAGGAAEALEGRWRFVDLYAGRPAPEGSMLPPGENEALAIESIGISYKAYPTCAATHLSLDALLALRAGIDPGGITAIETDLPLVLSRNLMHPRPTTGMEARFSMEYCLAAAATQGTLTLADFEGDAIHRGPIRALMPRITMRGVPEPEDGPPPPTRVTLHLADGTTRTETRIERRGSRGNPMSEAEHDAKFRDCASHVLDAAGTARALAAISGLATGGDAASLVDTLVP